MRAAHLGAGEISADFFGIDPRAMLQFFAALKKELLKRDGGAPAFGL